MAKTITNLSLMLGILLFILACATSSGTPPAAGFVDTAIAGTYSVAISQTVQVQALHAESQSVTPTNTKVPSVTPLPTFTVVVLGGAEVRALADVSCREGPGSVYKQVFVLRKDRLADLVGRSADGRYLVIRNPNKTNELCWLDAAMVQINGVAVLAPMLTAPPTPKPTRTPTRAPKPTRTPTNLFVPTFVIGKNTPSAARFDTVFDSVGVCTNTNSWWINFEITNTGKVTLESIALLLRDNTAGSDLLTLDSEDFTERTGCGTSDTVDAIPVASSHIVSAPILNYDPTGHVFEALTELCSGPAHTGLCEVQMMRFTP